MGKRITHESSRSLPKRSRTLPVYGTSKTTDAAHESATDDAGKWYRCWRCGFICNEDRDSIGTPESKTAVNLALFVPRGEFIVESAWTSGVRRGHVGVSSELGYDGNAKVAPLYYRPDVTGGCPMCGNMNWRGDF